MVILVVCGTSADGHASLATSPENLERCPWMLADDGLEQLYCIRGASYDECMQVYYDNQGWGRYSWPSHGPRTTHRPSGAPRKEWFACPRYRRYFNTFRSMAR